MRISCFSFFIYTAITLLVYILCTVYKDILVQKTASYVLEKYVKTTSIVTSNLLNF